MLEVLIGLIIFVISFGFGYVYNSTPKEPPVFHITMPEIKIPPIEVNVVGATNHAIDSVDYAKLAEDYEAKIEKEDDKRIAKAEKMTEEFTDLNSIASDLMDGYIDGTHSD